jgi:hypothetical protein
MVYREEHGLVFEGSRQGAGARRDLSSLLSWLRSWSLVLTVEATVHFSFERTACVNATRPQCRCCLEGPAPFDGTKPKKANKKPIAMKTVSILALSTLVSSTIAGSSYDTQAANLSSPSLRGSASTPNITPAPESIAAEDGERSGHRELLLPDQTCYEIGIYGNAMTIPCDNHVFSDCYTYPQCADTPQDA